MNPILEWDDAKADANFAKHGVRFPEVSGAFLDERGVTMLDEFPDEERYITIGMDTLGRLIVVVYTWRGDSIRVISARKATRTERRLYAVGEP